MSVNIKITALFSDAS